MADEMPIVHDHEFFSQTLISRDELTRIVCVVEAILDRRRATGEPAAVPKKKPRSPRLAYPAPDGRPPP
jgi:hypothetical protein